MRRLETESGGAWRPSPGSVYPMLQQLEDEGLVRSSEDEGRKTYELTDAGRGEADPTKLAALAAEGERGGNTDLRSELEKLHLAVRQVRAVGNDAQVAEAAATLREARQSVYRILAEG
jgi:DNA-binding PadR family transcriptional regulator